MEISSVSPTVAKPVDTAALTVRSAESRAQTRELIQAVRQANESQIAGQNSELVVSVDRRTGRLLVRIVDKESREVIQQIPAEHVLRMVREWNERRY